MAKIRDIRILIFIIVPPKYILSFPQVVLQLVEEIIEFVEEFLFEYSLHSGDGAPLKVL